MSEIVVTENATPPSLPIAQVLQTIVRAAENPAVDVAKMRELLGLQKELMAMQAEQHFNAAYHAMRRLMPRIRKNGAVMYKDKETGAWKESFKFAKWEDVMSGIEPLLDQFGFDLDFTTEQRSEAARNAVRARWKRYREKKALTTGKRV